MFERFTRDARQVVRSAETLAAGLGSPTTEAEHLLLALADCEPVLADFGLDHDGVLAALEAERERSLRAVGISASDFDLPPAPLTRPHFAASSKLALERAVRAAAARSHKRIGGGHILLGVLAAEAGTVPRALQIAGVDRQELRDRAAASLN
jgi:ATP-dependent Clp protease ATP-binding subunit ClpA